MCMPWVACVVVQLDEYSFCKFYNCHLQPLYEGHLISSRTVLLIKHQVNIEYQKYSEVVPPLMYTTYRGFLYDYSVMHDAWCFSALTLLVGRQEGHPACKKTERCGAGVVICLERVADLHTAQLMPLPLTVSCLSKIQIGFTFLVPAHLGSPGPGQRAVKRVCVCVCVRARAHVCACACVQHDAVTWVPLWQLILVIILLPSDLAVHL